MTINTDTSFVPATRTSLAKSLKRLWKRLPHLISSWQEFNASRNAPPLDDHLRRDIGLPDAAPRLDRHLAGWKDPLSVEIRRKW